MSFGTRATIDLFYSKMMRGLFRFEVSGHNGCWSMAMDESVGTFKHKGSNLIKQSWKIFYTQYFHCRFDR